MKQVKLKSLEELMKMGFHVSPTDIGGEKYFALMYAKDGVVAAFNVHMDDLHKPINVVPRNSITEQHYKFLKEGFVPAHIKGVPDGNGED